MENFLMSMSEPGELFTFSEKDARFAGIFDRDIEKFQTQYDDWLSYPWAFIKRFACSPAKVRLVYYFNYNRPITGNSLDKLWEDMHTYKWKWPNWFHCHYDFDILNNDQRITLLNWFWEKIEQDERFTRK